jgi:hypothetical protein
MNFSNSQTKRFLMVYVTKKGYEALLKRHYDLMERLKVIQKQKGETVELGGDTWHDNFAFEELVRQERVLNKQVGDASRDIAQAVIVTGKPKDTVTLQVGHIAYIYFMDDETMKEVVVGGFGETNLSADPPVVDYGAPIVKPFFGFEVGHEAEVILDGKNRCLVLDSIK